MNRNGWTPERRQRMRMMIRRWRPWTSSTGPRTPEGKARVSRNAFKGGCRAHRRQFAREVRGYLEEVRRLNELVRPCRL